MGAKNYGPQITGEQGILLIKILQCKTRLGEDNYHLSHLMLGGSGFTPMAKDLTGKGVISNFEHLGTEIWLGRFDWETFGQWAFVSDGVLCEHLHKTPWKQ